MTDDSISKRDERKTKSELLYEIRLLRLENVQLQEQLDSTDAPFADQRQLHYLENTALIDEVIRTNTDLDAMMDRLMDVVRSIFQCDQAWLLHPCDPHAGSWRVPFRSVHDAHPIHFGPDEDLPYTPDLAENCRLALQSEEPVPLGLENRIKHVPEEARQSAARSALLKSIHPKVGRPWLMGLHQCSASRRWTAEEKRMFHDISGRIADALSTTLFNRNLERNRDRLKHLSTQLFRAQEEERKRIAEEIHDELGQAALAIKMGVENALFTMGDVPEPTQKSLQSASNLSQHMVDAMRRMQAAIYPPTLRDFGLITALGGFLKDFGNIYSSLTVKQAIHITEKDIPKGLRVTLFRLAQEALYNAANHSGGDAVRVSLDRIGCRLILEVKDNGCGFDPQATLRYPDKRLGLGLTSMKERAEMVDGKLTIESVAGEGTAIRAIWELDEDLDGNDCDPAESSEA